MTVTEPCLQCGLPKDPEIRCPSCGMTAEFGPTRPNPFRSGTLWAMMGAIAAVFAITLVVVSLTS
ncbi:MAG: hypothetical protein JJE46_01150 [Acidimicrobiia bacterium]|nr:hypothetical protein [Acidimicrobiia bacterium]